MLDVLRKKCIISEVTIQKGIIERRKLIVMSTNYDAHTGARCDGITLCNIVTGEAVTLEKLQERNQELPKVPRSCAAVAPAAGGLVVAAEAQGMLAAPAVAALVA